MKTLRLVLGDQLDLLHSWLQERDDTITNVLMEIRQETDYVRHHIQKVVGIFAAVRRFATLLSGWRPPIPRGMSQYTDGRIEGSKRYVASANYMQKALQEKPSPCWRTWKSCKPFPATSAPEPD